jgi:uncharacterized protein (TIGR00269 family)
MKCRTCGRPAVINMRQHKLALCADHYLDWFVRQTERTIRKYRMFTPEARILVAVSGGKDSLALWDVLLRLGYHADGLYIDLGIDGGLDYSHQSRAKAEAFAAAHPETRLIIVDIPATYGESIPQVAARTLRGRQRPCSVCGLVKRHEMNRVALEEGYDVLATGHNLDDEVAVLFGNTMQWKVGYLQRQGPVLPADAQGLARKVKPLCRFYERETAAYALLRGIDYIYDECPFSKGATSLRYKELLAQMEHRSPGAKLHFYIHFLKAKEEGLFCPEEQTRPPMHPCERCGQPTTAPGLCAFCRLWVRKDEAGGG